MKRRKGRRRDLLSRFTCLVLSAAFFAMGFSNVPTNPVQPKNIDLQTVQKVATVSECSNSLGPPGVAIPDSYFGTRVWYHDNRVLVAA